MKNTIEIQLDTLINLVTDLPKRLFEALDDREREIGRKKIIDAEALRLSFKSLEDERKMHDMENKRG